MINLNYSWIEVACSHCGYIIDIQFWEVKSETVTFCNNCKYSIKLIDENASVHRATESINEAIKDFEKIFKNFGK